MGENEFLRGSVLRDQRVHGFLKHVNAVDVVHGFSFVVVEERGYSSVRRGFRVPF